MPDRTLEETLIELQRILKEDLSKPFPYDDCRRVLAKAGVTGADLISYLDLYFGDIAGYCSWGKNLLRMSKDDLNGARALLARSFFEKHPEYLPLTALINETDTPTLFAELGLYDKVRLQLLAVIAELLSEPEASEPLLADALVRATPGWSVRDYPSSQNRVSE